MSFYFFTNNTEGLRHDGIAGKLRSMNTDFGSGYQGPDNSNSIIHVGLRRNLKSISQKGLQPSEAGLTYSLIGGRGNVIYGLPERKFNFFLKTDQDKLIGLGVPQTGIVYRTQVDPSKVYAGYFSGFLSRDVSYRREKYSDFLKRKDKPELYEILMPEAIPPSNLEILGELQNGEMVPLGTEEKPSLLWNATRTAASFTLLAAGIASKNIPFEETLQKWFKGAAPAVRYAPAALWGLGEISKFGEYESPGKSFVRLGGSIAAWEVSRRLAEKITTPLAQKLGHKGLPGIIGHAAALLSAGIYSSHFSAKDDYYNTIEGLRHDGIAGNLRPMNTDFGSGYQGPDNSNSITSNVFAAEMGVGTGYGIYKTFFPWTESELQKYPKLQALRERGKKYGIKLFASEGPLASEIPWSQVARGERLTWLIDRFILGPLRPTSKYKDIKSFKGAIYLRGDSPDWAEMSFAKGAALSEDIRYSGLAIGGDKITTWRYFEALDIQKYHVPTLAGEDLFSEFFEGLSAQGEEFLKKYGGTENMVIKSRSGARGVGVWMSINDMPEEVFRQFRATPEEFLLQPRLDLAEEFRVVTTGGKATQVTYRFGTPWMRKLAKKLGYTPTKDLVEKVARVSPFEIIAPVLRKDYRKPLIEFAEEAAAKLPYDIGALDIGLTKEGKFYIIEAQKEFGNIGNPMVVRRISNLATGKSGGLALGASIAGGFAAYSLFAPEKTIHEKYNTIEGLRHGGVAGVLRPENTDFGSGFKGPRKAIEIISRFFKSVKRPPAADWEAIHKVADPLIALDKAVKGRAVDFVQRAPIVKMIEPGEEFTKRFFGNPRAGRTYASETAVIPMITSPSHIKGNLLREYATEYKMAGVHEIGEAAFANSPFALSPAGARFLRKTGHYDPNVLRVQGLYAQQIGISMQELKVAYSEIPGFKYIKEGWKHGIKSGRVTNPVNPIKAHEGNRWGRETIMSSGDFRPGSSWRGDLVPFAEKLISMFNESRTLYEFGIKTGTRMLERATEAFPEYKFALGKARTVFTTEAGEFGLKARSQTELDAIQEIIKTGNITLVPTIASPRVLSKKYSAQFFKNNPEAQRVWAGSVAHEQFEIHVMKFGKPNLEFARAYGHVSPDVLRAHGYFMQGVGIPEKTLEKLYRNMPGDQYKYFLEGYQYRAAKMNTRAAVAHAETREYLRKAITNIKYANDIRSVRDKRQFYEYATAAHKVANPIHLNKYRRTSHGVDR